MADPKDTARPRDVADAPAPAPAPGPAPTSPRPVPIAAVLPPAPPTPVVPAPPPERDPKSPYTGATEIKAGGVYMRGTTYKGGKHYGGEIVNGKGEVLATFADDKENTGSPEDGTKPEKAKE